MSLAVNRKIHHDYETMDKYSAGVELLGHEVKSIRNGKVSLVGGKAILSGGEAFLVGVDIHPYQENNTNNFKIKYDKLRTRKLLFKKSEITKLYKTLEDKHLHLLPLSIYDSHGIIKLDLALCKKINKHDKREKIKERDFEQRGE